MIAWLFYANEGLRTMQGWLERMAALTLAATVFPAARAEEDEPKLDVALWDKSVTLRGALGYKDNVLLSSTQEDGSAFWQSALDVTLLRLSLDQGPNVTFFLSGEDRRYFSAEQIHKEQLLLTHLKLEQPFLEDWTASAALQYMYADQVYDASATEQILTTMPVKSHNIQVAPGIKRSLPGNSELELKLTAERQYFNEPLDDYWEFGPQLIYTKKYGHRSEATASYTLDHRNYDTRRELDLDFQEVPDTSLEYIQHEFELGVNHAWDEKRHWRSRARLLFEINDDGGTGFYDYYRYRLSKRIGYFADTWEATLEGKILHYDYRKQPVFGGTEVRSTWEYVIAAQGRKTIWKTLGLFADFEHEISDSNSALEEYTVTTIMGGVDWEF
jgi:hypothetical protein